MTFDGSDIQARGHRSTRWHSRVHPVQRHTGQGQGWHDLRPLRPLGRSPRQGLHLAVRRLNGCPARPLVRVQRLGAFSRTSGRESGRSSVVGSMRRWLVEIRAERTDHLTSRSDRKIRQELLCSRAPRLSPTSSARSRTVHPDCPSSVGEPLAPPPSSFDRTDVPRQSREETRASVCDCINSSRAVRGRSLSPLGSHGKGSPPHEY